MIIEEFARASKGRLRRRARSLGRYLLYLQRRVAYFRDVFKCFCHNYASNLEGTCIPLYTALAIQWTFLGKAFSSHIRLFE